MKYQKFNKYEKKEVKRKQLQQVMGGSGLFLFENNTVADMTLPRPTKSGRRQLGPKGSPDGQFQGDDYYMQMVRTGDLRLIKVLQTPEQEQQAQLKEQTMVQQGDKLILDQPEIVTEHGQIEHVVDNSVPKQPLHEGDGQEGPPVLLNESPDDDGFVIVEDE